MKSPNHILTHIIFSYNIQLKNNINTEKKLIKEVTEQQTIERKQFEKKMTQEYKLKKERWKREMAVCLTIIFKKSLFLMVLSIISGKFNPSKSFATLGS